MGERPGWLLTIRQTAPDAFRLVRKLAPTFEVAGATAIDEAFLEAHGIRGLIWDVDGTLTAYHAPAPPPAVAGHLERLSALPWLRQVILSNCGEERFGELGGIFPGTEILKVYAGPSGLVFRWRVGGRDEWEGGAGPAGLQPIRKPNAELVRYAVRRLGVEPGEAAMVGDQYWTDVAGANLAGVRSIKVPALVPSSFPPAIRFFQVVESVLRRVAAA
ncbi:MAG: HAD hydrolase-like protein [Gemmatimonadota bacterium]